MTEQRFQVAIVKKSTITLDTPLALAVEKLQTRVPSGTIIPTTKFEPRWPSTLFDNFSLKVLRTFFLRTMSSLGPESFIQIYKP